MRSTIGGQEFAVLAFPVREPARALDSLTEAERAVATLVIDGLSNAEIATRRGTSVRTVANQLQSLYRKLNVASRLELARLGLATRH